MKVSGKRLCVIGGAGYVGSRLVPRLIELGHDVTVVDLCWFGNHLDPSTTLIKKDILALSEADLKGFDAVLFLAGLASDPMAEYAPAYNFVSNLAAPAYAAFIARKAEVPRFIFAESCSVYGDAHGAVCLEEDPLRWLPYPYGISKAQGNVSVMYLHQVGPEFSVIALRKGTVSGQSPRMRFDLLVNAMYKSAWMDGKIVVNNPKIGRPLLALSDLVEAYVLAINAPQEVSGTFNIVSQNVTVGEVARDVQSYIKKVHGAEIAVEELDRPDVRDYRASSAKAEKILGFAAKGSVTSILGELDEQFGPKFDFTPEYYYNIKTFKKIFDTQPLL